MSRTAIHRTALLSVAFSWPGALMAQTAAPVPSDPQAQAAAPVQANGDTGIADIVVTAQKRASTTQNTPLAITAVGGADIAARQITDIQNLAPSLPNVNFGTNVGFARIAIRGLGLDATTAGQEGRVAYHTDGVYISRPTAQMATFFDINRVEVVRGPQGTLYGRNATAGAINVITNDPTDTEQGYFKITGGNYGLIRTEGAISGAASDTLSARFAFQTNDRGGYGENATTGQHIDNNHSFGVRAKMKYEPNNKFRLLLSVDYSYERDHNNVYHYIGEGKPGVTPFGPALGGSVAKDPRNTYGNVPPDNQDRFAGFGATANYEFGFATLTSITGYRDSSTFLQADSDGTQIPLGTLHISEKAHQVSEELRLSGAVSNLKWIVGGYFFNEHIDGTTNISPIRSPITTKQVQGVDYTGKFSTSAYAAFAQLDYQIISGLTVSAGARYSYEKRGINLVGVVDLFTPYNHSVPYDYSAFQDESTTFTATTPRASIEYKPSTNILMYATYAKGFKSGGFNLGAVAPPVRPEKLTDYEGGIKTKWFDDHLQLNLAGFYYDYKDLQVQTITNANAVLTNAASAHVKGVEVEVVARLVRGLEISANGSWLDARFTNFLTPDPARLELGVLNLAGNRLPQAPKYTANIAAQYMLPTSVGKVTLRGEASYTDRVYFSFFNRPEVSQDAYVKGNVILSLSTPKGITASLFVRNIADKRTISTAQVSTGIFGFPIMGAYDPPRTFGGSIGINF